MTSSTRWRKRWRASASAGCSTRSAGICTAAIGTIGSVVWDGNTYVVPGTTLECRRTMEDLLNTEDVEQIEKDDLSVGDVISVVHENKEELYVDEDEITYISESFGIRTPFADESENEDFHSDGGAGIGNLQDPAYTIYRH